MKANAREIFTRAFHRLTRKLSLSQRLTAEEQLENVLKEDKRQRFIADVISIRRSGDYVPVYNKPKKHQDYTLTYEADDEIKIVSPETKLGHERPENFLGEDGSQTNAAARWMVAVRLAHEKHLDDERLKTLQQSQHEEVKSSVYEFMVNKMTSVKDPFFFLQD